MRFTSKTIIAGALAMSSLIVAPQVCAQAYVGGSIGKSDIDESFTNGLITSGSVDGKDNGFKIFGGYQFNRHLAVELAYVDLGEASYSGTFDGLPVTGGKAEVSGFNVAAVGILPVSDRFSVFGKAGLFVWDAEANDTTAGAPFSAKRDGTDLSLGIGVSFDLTRNFIVRGEWERFKLDDSNASLLSLGVMYKF